MWKPTLVSLAATILLTAACAASADPVASRAPERGTLDRLVAPGQWYAVPRSHLLDAVPAESQAEGLRGWTGPRSITGAWSGGSFDVKRERLLVWGGGHSDYAGNEIYAFDLQALKWSALTRSSPLAGFVEGSDAMPD